VTGKSSGLKQKNSQKSPYKVEYKHFMGQAQYTVIPSKYLYMDFQRIPVCALKDYFMMELTGSK